MGWIIFFCLGCIASATALGIALWTHNLVLATANTISLALNISGLVSSVSEYRRRR